MLTEIPSLDHVEYDVWNEPGKPGWVQLVDSEGKRLKPIIRCNCGMWCGIGLHHVHSDGTVTASFLHTLGSLTGVPEGCGWHVFLKLLDWTGEDFPPEPK